MHVAIVITLFFASATSALGLPRAMARYRLQERTVRAALPPLIAAAMALWFCFAAFWTMNHR